MTNMYTFNGKEQYRKNQNLCNKACEIVKII